MQEFEKLLLDADWSLNAGNWMWLSASAFFHQYFRVYSPVAFGKKTDPNGDYIRCSVEYERILFKKCNYRLFDNFYCLLCFICVKTVVKVQSTSRHFDLDLDL